MTEPLLSINSLSAVSDRDGGSPVLRDVALTLGRGEVRGLGLMQGIELVKDRQTKEPYPEGVLKVFEETKRQGVLIGKGGLYGNVIRTGMMLNSTKDTVDQLVAALDAGLALC